MDNFNHSFGVVGGWVSVILYDGWVYPSFVGCCCRRDSRPIDVRTEDDQELGPLEIRASHTNDDIKSEMFFVPR